MGGQPGPSGPPPGPSAGPPVAPGSLGAFDGPTQRPNEPVTAGADAGPGPGSEILGLPQPGEDSLLKLVGKLPLLERIAGNPQATPESRILFRKVYAVALERGLL